MIDNANILIKIFFPFDYVFKYKVMDKINCYTFLYEFDMNYPNFITPMDYFDSFLNVANLKSFKKNNSSTCSKSNNFIQE